MLIKNYGLYWHADRVAWGKRGKGNQGTMLGHKRQKEGSVDFREQAGVYCLYDDDFHLLYVGQASGSDRGLFKRLDEHRSGGMRERWSRFSWFGIRKVEETESGGVLGEAPSEQASVDQVLNHLEAILIAAAEPTLNRQGGRFGDAVYYYQTVAEGAESIESRLSLLTSKIESLEGKLAG